MECPDFVQAACMPFVGWVCCGVVEQEKKIDSREGRDWIKSLAKFVTGH